MMKPTVADYAAGKQMYFIPRITLLILFIISAWNLAAKSLHVAKMESDSNVPKVFQIFPACVMTALFLLGLIGSAKNSATLIIVGLMGAGVFIFVTGAQLIMVLTELINNHVYGTEMCRSSCFFDQFRDFCIRYTVIHTSFNIIVFLATIYAFKALYKFWKAMNEKEHRRVCKDFLRRYRLDNIERPQAASRERGSAGAAAVRPNLSSTSV